VKLQEPIRVAAHKRAFDDARMEVVYDGPITAPVSAGDVIGKLVITVEGKDEPIIAPLVATESVAKLGFIGRAVEGLSLKLSGDDAAAS
jgi:D-alanyl-D-alanine carboxypeptidase (penicillin-binding protein 5/6)